MIFHEIKWLDILGYEGLYKVSSMGEIWTIKRNKYRKQSFDKNSGYLKVVLYRKSENKTFFIHRLIAIAFIPNPLKKPCVNHKDGEKRNNHLSNLEWCTYSENMRHSVKNKFHNHYRNLRPYLNKPIIQLYLNGKTRQTWNSIQLASKNTGVSRTAIQNNLSGLSKKAGGYKWSYNNVRI